MSEKLKYTSDGLKNRIIFLSQFNDINIVVEDTDKEYEYDQIFDRLFNNKIQVTGIFPMSGKPGVKKAFEQYGHLYKDKPVFYIVDGDFDLIMNKDMVKDAHFFYLENYNIEDYYIEKNSTLKFLGGKLKKTRKETDLVLDYDFWENDSYKKLIDLFICFIIIQQEDPSQKNISANNEFYYIDQNTGLFDQTKINDYINTIKIKISNYDDLHSFYYDKYCNLLSSNPLRIICGKYLVRGLYFYIRAKTNGRINFRFEDFKYSLLNTFNISSLDYIGNQILDITKTIKAGVAGGV